jgi:hypothetical protein
MRGGLNPSSAQDLRPDHGIVGMVWLLGGRKKLTMPCTPKLGAEESTAIGIFVIAAQVAKRITAGFQDPKKNKRRQKSYAKKYYIHNRPPYSASN